MFFVLLYLLAKISIEIYMKLFETQLEVVPHWSLSINDQPLYSIKIQAPDLCLTIRCNDFLSNLSTTKNQFIKHT